MNCQNTNSTRQFNLVRIIISHNPVIKYNTILIRIWCRYPVRPMRKATWRECKSQDLPNRYSKELNWLDVNDPYVEVRFSVPCITSTQFRILHFTQQVRSTHQVNNKKVFCFHTFNMLKLKVNIS